MTWSITARDPETGALAVVVATRAFAVGANCPFVRAGVGAVSTQSITNRYLAPAVLDGIAAGLTLQEAIARAVAPDGGRGLRQLHVTDAQGRTAAWTGDNCVMWCGSVSDKNVSVAGNMLANGRVVEATLETYNTSSGLELPERLHAAMCAGEAVGGDRRGRQSAAMKIVTSEDFPDLDLRVDDHPDPLAELARLIGLWRSHWLPRKHWAPTRTNPSGAADMDVIEAGWIAQGLDLRFRRP